MIIEREKIILQGNKMNRQISQNIYMSIDTKRTDLNNNWLVIGGPGTGKSYRIVKPQLLTNLASSFLITDPKGEILRDAAPFLKKHGYEIKVFNILSADGMKSSNRYNPFKYVRTDNDILKLVSTFMNNTKKQDSGSGDQFWDDMAGLRLQAFFFYVRDFGIEVDGELQYNFRGVMDLINKDKVEEGSQGERLESEVDRIFKRVEEKQPFHPGVIAYNKSNVGAADTVRSIISTLNSRTACFNTKEVLDLLSEDEMDIPMLGMGKNYDKKTKTALFCVIPDSDTTFNCIVGMLYSQIFQELYHYADNVCRGRLPIHVTCILDEFANVPLPDNFLKDITVMRGREISTIIIIQALSQLKKLYKDSWDTIPQSSSVLIYLGGNGQEEHKYFSEAMGKATIDKRTTGQTLGKNGSSSRNEDVLGREIMTSDEVGRLDSDKCIVLIQGYLPIIDDKIRTAEHPLFYEMDGSYVHHPEYDRKRNQGISFINNDYVNHVIRESKDEGICPCLDISLESILAISDEEIINITNSLQTSQEDIENDVMSELMNIVKEKDEEYQLNLIRHQEEEEKVKRVELKNLESSQVIEYAKLKNYGYSERILYEILPLITHGKKYEEIKCIFSVDTELEEVQMIMQAYLSEYEKEK